MRNAFQDDRHHCFRETYVETVGADDTRSPGREKNHDEAGDWKIAPDGRVVALGLAKIQPRPSDEVNGAGCRRRRRGRRERRRGYAGGLGERRPGVGDVADRGRGGEQGRAGVRSARDLNRGPERSQSASSGRRGEEIVGVRLARARGWGASRVRDGR